MKRKKLAIVQSNYIPWKGYFDLIAAADEFILYDEVQFTKNDWRNRNKIKTPTGTQWITIPVGTDISKRVCDVGLPDTKWQIRHWNTLKCNYASAPYYEEISRLIHPVYFENQYKFLSELNYHLIQLICDFLEIKTKISKSSDYKLINGKSERLANLCAQTDAQEYLSGPAAQNYLDEQIFKDHGIKVTWFDYDGYVEYPQLWGEFSHFVSILDLLFNCGKNTCHYMRYLKK